jgi:hypothetical protein
LAFLKATMALSPGTRLGLQIRELEGLEKTVSQKESDVRQILASL